MVYFTFPISINVSTVRQSKEGINQKRFRPWYRWQGSLKVSSDIKRCTINPKVPEYFGMTDSFPQSQFRIHSEKQGDHKNCRDSQNCDVMHTPYSKAAYSDSDWTDCKTRLNHWNNSSFANQECNFLISLVWILLITITAFN